MRTFAVSAIFAAMVVADGHLPTGDENGMLISPAPMPQMEDQDKMHQLEEMIDVFCEGLDKKEHHDDMHDMHDMHDKDHGRLLMGHDDHDDMGHRNSTDHHGDHDGRRGRGEHIDHEHTKDMWLCMQAKKMHWELEQYHMDDHRGKKEQVKDWRKDIKEMKRDWGMGGASDLAMAGAAMIVAVSALAF